MKIIAIICAYDEEEVIKNCVENAREQGLSPIIIDNGCTDGTIKIARGLEVPIFEHKTEKFDCHQLIKWGVRTAKRIGCDWYTIKDADEMFETYDGRKVADVVAEADEAGHNSMRFDLYEFWPTVDDDLSIKDFTERIQHYTYCSSNYLKMIKNSREIRTYSPHEPRGKIMESPVRLLARHYKFINLEQGRRKVKSRLARFDTNVRKNTQYNGFTDESKFYVLEKDVYSRLNKVNGTWVGKRVFNGWRTHCKQGGHN